MLCLGDSIRYDAPSLQRLLHTFVHPSHASQGSGQCAASYSPKKVAIGVRLST
jgi:hypothetical protein